MKTYKILTIIGLLSLTALTFSAFRTPRKAKAAPNNGFALVELFTSEGCSSCPPADELVAKIVKEDKNLPVYVLAYHVDYWNSLGWKDQFSSAEYSSRQRQYAGWLKLESVYTPQIVVNGKTEFVGSNESSLRSAIQNGLQKANNDQLTIDNASVNANQLTVQYETKASSANRDLLIAFVQKAGHTDVKRGENGGRVLNHVNIVREMNSISLKQPNGTATVKLPQGYNAQGWEVIGFVQNISNGEILSAQKVVLSGI
ncbi:DUF1223 domain-containing protein [uncultured Mucilaginibacter sp.]|uniref:DUF1223 domain-containing protein n=1 Tax=uncultured Mucilaginibacter sp. TaxID=797541 RepID=UPI0025D96598|nr:DUF1223 domain-containing protein [uncultured Mucilaginibacter sp.]